MADYEKLGVFYLGRFHDLETKKTSSELLLYESKHLVTHGLVAGMTGSGKTGLCVDLIEEAAIDGIPAILLDPKGDLGNLLLTFPEFRPEDFSPWVNPDEAQRHEISVAELGARQAELWRSGLARWDQSGERIRRLRDATEFALYTPGSTAGLPISILKSFAVPPADILEDGELLRERVASTVSSLLALAGIRTDSPHSRETILMSHLLQQAWGAGRDLDLATLIHQVQQPPVQRIGVLDLESFFPAPDRFELAMRVNSLLASPSFASWRDGEALDIGRLLYTPAGKPRVVIFSIAHLGDSERMFFVTLLLNQMLSWMRSQSGTNSLRALFYMDEIFGYFPPVANPPSKQPLLTLLKQARAFGLGVVLATQNPVDLDYRGLANIGTWFIGRLQTDRDKARVLEGLEGAAAGRGVAFDRAKAEQILAGLGSRVFLLHSVHQEGFDVFESRWAMSYLRGPLSRNQIKQLVESQRPLPAPSVPPAPAPVHAASAAPSAVPSAPAAALRPVLPPQVPQFWLPVRGQIPADSMVVLQPRLFGSAQVRFADAKLKIEAQKDVTAVTEITDGAIPVDWVTAELFEISLSDLGRTPLDGEYVAPAPPASQVKNYPTWARDFEAWIQSATTLKLLRSPVLRLISLPGEEERDFRIRLNQAAREERDAAADKLRQKYAPKIAALQERVRRAQAAKQRETEQAQRAKMSTFISLGSTVLGAFLGRKVISASSLGRAANTARSVGRAVEQAGDVNRAHETIQAMQQQLGDLETQFQTEADALTMYFNPGASLESVELRPTRSNINVRLVALVWVPFARSSVGVLTRLC